MDLFFAAAHGCGFAFVQRMARVGTGRRLGGVDRSQARRSPVRIQPNGRCAHHKEALPLEHHWPLPNR